MSTFVMILTAAMAIPGNGPEKVLAEMEQGLDLSGEWEGTWQIAGGGFKRFSLSNGELAFWGFSLPCRFYIEKQQRNRLRIQWAGRPYPGIYERDDKRIRICLNVAEDGQPTTFELGDNRVILTLHRVKPRK
jgi:hypothetical protein